MSATSRAGMVPADEDLERLSAWLDGELEPDQHAAMLERVKSDPQLRAQFEWLSLAGDALRSHEVAACHRPDLVRRVGLAVQAEPVRIGPGSLGASRLRRHVATGITVAAAAGVLAVVALPQLRAPEPAPAVAALPVASAARATVPVSSVEPAAPKASLAARSPQLDAYLRAHRELAATGVMPSAAAYIRMEPDR